MGVSNNYDDDNDSDNDGDKNNKIFLEKNLRVLQCFKRYNIFALMSK